MTQIGLVVAGLVCSLVGFSSALGEVPDETKWEIDATDLTTDFSTVHAEPLAFDGVKAGSNAVGFQAQNGVYIVGYGLFAQLDGEFDGNIELVNPTLPDRIFVPGMDEGYGVGGGFGFRHNEMAVEFTYQWTNHDTDLLGVPLSDAQYHTFNIDLKWYPWDETPIQPHFLVGLVIPWLAANSASLNTTTGAIGDANFVGAGVNVGGGLTIYLDTKVALIVQGGYRFAWMTSAKGVTGPRASIDGNLEAFGFFAMAGMSFTF